MRWGGLYMRWNPPYYCMTVSAIPIHSILHCDNHYTYLRWSPPCECILPLPYLRWSTSEFMFGRFATIGSITMLKKEKQKRLKDQSYRFRDCTRCRTFVTGRWNFQGTRKFIFFLFRFASTRSSAALQSLQSFWHGWIRLRHCYRLSNSQLFLAPWWRNSR